MHISHRGNNKANVLLLIYYWCFMYNIILFVRLIPTSLHHCPPLSRDFPRSELGVRRLKFPSIQIYSIDSRSFNYLVSIFSGKAVIREIFFLKRNLFCPEGKKDPSLLIVFFPRGRAKHTRQCRIVE